MDTFTCRSGTCFAHYNIMYMYIHVHVHVLSQENNADIQCLTTRVEPVADTDTHRGTAFSHCCDCCWTHRPAEMSIQCIIIYCNIHVHVHVHVVDSHQMCTALVQCMRAYLTSSVHILLPHLGVQHPLDLSICSVTYMYTYTMYIHP